MAGDDADLRAGISEQRRSVLFMSEHEWPYGAVLVLARVSSIAHRFSRETHTIRIPGRPPHRVAPYSRCTVSRDACSLASVLAVRGRVTRGSPSICTMYNTLPPFYRIVSETTFSSHTIVTAEQKILFLRPNRAHVEAKVKNYFCIRTSTRFATKASANRPISAVATANGFVRCAENGTL